MNTAARVVLIRRTTTNTSLLFSLPCKYASSTFCNRFIHGSFHTNLRAKYAEQFNYPQHVYFSALQHSLESITETMEPLVEKLAEDDEDCDLELSDGVLTLNLGKKGTFVISRQTPTRQLWLSSPISGPWHYEFDATATVWKCTKSPISFWQRMETELSQIFDTKIEFKKE